MLTNNITMGYNYKCQREGRTNKMANIRDVAKAASVSISTVSSVLNGNKYVSDDLVQRVLHAVDEVGYRPGEKESRTQPRKSVAVILPGTYSSFFSPLISGIEDIASDHNYDVILYDSQRNFQRERELMGMLARRNVRNIIVDSVCCQKNESIYIEELKEKMIRRNGANIVMVEREVHDESVHSIFVDNYEASYLITRHLIDMGRRHIAHISGAEQFPHAEIRAQGYRKAMEDAGLEPDKRWLMMGDFTPLSGFGLVQELLGKGIDIDAIYASNDQMAIGAIKAIRKFGLKVPQDIAVAGFDNLKFSSLITPGITTIQYPVYQMGFQAMQMIALLEAGQSVAQKVKLNTRLIVRQSTDAAVLEDWDLQEW